MDNNSEKTLKECFLVFLKDPTCVCVENFYEKMEGKNKLLTWSDKGIKWDDFNRHFKEHEPPELELYIEGYRCLAQIHINLLKDFEIFKIYPIRKYSSAFNYISKITNYEKLLKAIDYELKDEEKKYKFKEDQKQLSNREDAEDTALKLLICFMELSEMIKIRYDMCEMQDLIVQREKNIKQNIEKLELGQMTDDQKLAKFEKCEICDNKMDMIKGECEVCQYSVADFSFSYKFKDLLEKKFNVKVKIPENVDNTENEETNEKMPIPNSRQQGKKPEPRTEVPDDKWSCKQCTFLNESGNLNCTICEAKKS